MSSPAYGALLAVSLSASQLFADRYRILRRLGRGGTSVVYLAEDVLEGREVAVKTPRVDVAQHPSRGTWVERFRREAEAIERLEHPGIVRFYEFGVSGDLPYLVFEHLPGRDLSEVTRFGPLQPEVVRDLGLQLLDALTHAHKCAILHRDIKTSNLVLLKGWKLKLIDFGISSDHCTRGECATCPGGVSRALPSSTVRLLGTPGYMSPEQRAGDQEDASSDLWAVGTVLYELLTGRQPDLEDIDSALQVLIDNPDTRAFVPVIASAWSADPGARPQSASVMAGRLRRVRLDGDDVRLSA